MLMVLKGAKHITSSIATDPELKTAAATSFHNWATLDSRIGISSDSLNSENKSHAVDNKHSKSYLQEGQVICGNSSFLSRFIEFRFNDNTLSMKMASGTDNSNEESGSTDEGKMEGYLSMCHAPIEPSADCADPVSSEIALSDQLYNSATERINLSCLVIKTEGNDSKVQNKFSSPKQFEGNRVIGDIARNGLPKLSAIHRVEKLRKRIEDNVQNKNSTKEVCKNGNSEAKNHKDGNCIIQSVEEAKEDGSKLEIRRSGSNTRENPSRKLSFKVRCNSNNGRLSSSCMSSTASRRSSTLSKGLRTDTRLPNLSSSKVAALASKFNAIIHENKEDRNVEIIQNDFKKKLIVIPQLASGSTTTSTKKQPPTEKVFVSRRNSGNSKRENFSSNTGGNAKGASLSVALRKHSSTKQPVLESDSNHKPSSSANTKDCKRRSNVFYRPSAVGTKSGSVKAAIQIFEKNAAITPCAKSSAVVSAENSSITELKHSLESAETKKEPQNYPRVIFKRDATLVRVTLDFEDVCNEDQTTKQVADNINTQTSHWQKTSPELSPDDCEEENACVKNNEDSISHNTEDRSGQNVTVVTVGGSSLQDEKEQKQVKSKPAVPVKNVTKDQIYKSVPFSKSDVNDYTYVKVTCKADSIYRTTDNECMAEDTFVRYDKLEFPQKAAASSQSLIGKILTTREGENSQQRDKESMTPNRSFLWGTSPPATKSRTQDDQSTTVPVQITKDYEPTNPEDPAHVTNGDDDDTYDDVYPPSSVYSNGDLSIHPYSVVEPQDDDVYDDVGPPVTEEKQPPRIVVG